MLTPRLRTSVRSIHRRDAFTLLEVLVVVAILVVLASVASIQVFKYLEDSKKDKALMDMQALEQAYNTYRLKNDDQHPQSLQELTPYMTQGESSFVDPWNNQYQFREIQFGEGTRVQFFTMAKDGQELVWPRR